MTRSETLGIIVSGAFGPAMLLLYLTRVLTADLAFAFVGFSFAIALVPGIAENQRKKIGWSKRSCIMTGNNLFAFTAIFLTLGLVLTAISEFVSGAMWTVLLVQAFVYAKPKSEPKPIGHWPCKIDMEHLMMGGGAWCMATDTPHEIPAAEADRMLAAAEKARMGRTRVYDLPDSSYPYGTASDGTQWDDMGPI